MEQALSMHSFHYLFADQLNTHYMILN